MSHSLKNPFSFHVRALFMDSYECWICGRNGTTTGGLELHHIYGRISASALNAAPLCHKCHVKIGHTQKEHHTLLRKTINFLVNLHYHLAPRDNQFLEIIKKDLTHFKL